MQLTQIRYFLALCEDRNFTRAARRCGISQPSLTNAIKRLESELGGTLFERERENNRLSELGALVRPELAQIERYVVKAKNKAEKFKVERSASSHPRAMEASMRTNHVVAVLAAVVIVFGGKFLFFSSPPAEANIRASTNSELDIRKIQAGLLNRGSLPVQRMHDMTFVFSENE